MSSSTADITSQTARLLRLARMLRGRIHHQGIGWRAINVQPVPSCRGAL